VFLRFLIRGFLATFKVFINKLLLTGMSSGIQSKKTFCKPARPKRNTNEENGKVLLLALVIEIQFLILFDNNICRI